MRLKKQFLHLYCNSNKMELIMSYLDMPLKDKTPRQQELERRLREEIFIDWAGM